MHAFLLRSLVILALSFSSAVAATSSPLAPSACSKALAPQIITGTTTHSLWQIPRQDRLALEEIIRSGELARWNGLVPNAINETAKGKFQFIKLTHPKNQVSVVINMRHYVLPLIVAEDGSLRSVTTGEVVTNPYARGSTLLERLAQWFSIPQNMTRVKQGVAIAALVGVGTLAVYAYTQYRDVDWYDDSTAPALIEGQSPGSSADPSVSR
jgi:hypothetical protein